MAKVSRKNLELAKKELKSYDDLCSEMEKKIKKEYQQAHKEVAKKAEDYFKRFEKKDATWQKWVKDGTKTEQEYKAWRSGQMAMGQRWNDMRDVLATDLANTDKIASSIMNDYIPEAYALGHNWGTYEVESGTGINTSYTLYNHAAVEELLKNDPTLLPKSKVDIPKDKIWNKRHLDSAITQGILQGESIPAIAKRLEAVTDMNHKAALRNARTMTGSAENAGHYASYKRAENMGIKLEKQWIATLDSRTRTSHRYLHGETQKMDDMFSNGLMYPKDPSGAPEEVYNCRCRLVSNVIGYSRDLPTYSEKMGDMSYEEWLEAKPVYQKITHGEEVAEAQKMRYINEYRRGAKNLKNKSSVVNGRDLSEEWHRRADQFDFEIEDVINAQGFDGKPRVVSAEEFDEAVKKSNFVAQRTYSAPDQETLDAYRDQLYNGKWYVDCSTGGAQYGQGMYCAADYTGTLTDDIKAEMSHYGDLGRSRNDSAAKELAFQKVWDDALQSANDEEKALIKREFLRNATDEERHLARAFEKRDEDAYDALVDKYAAIAQKAKSASESAEAKSYTETLTLDPSAKVITYRELMDIRTGNLSLDYRTNVINDIIKKSNYTDDEATFIRFNLNTGRVTWNEVNAAAGRLTNERIQELSEEFSKIGEEATKRYNEEHARRIERAKMLQHKFSDPGSLAAALGYDAINAEGHGQSGSYTVILNRTKVIIKGE